MKTAESWPGLALCRAPPHQQQSQHQPAPRHISPWPTRPNILQGWLVLESASVSYGKATPYFPVMDLLKRYCHVDDGDDVRTIRAKVTGQVLTLDETLQDTLPALLALLDVVPDDSPFVHLDPSQRRQRTLQ